MDRYKQTNRIALFSLLGNVFLAIIKVTAGIFSHSNAMLADGLNSAGDVFSTLVTFVGNAISKKPKDEDHPHGHGKAEYIFSALIGLSLLFVAFKAMQTAVSSFMQPEPIQHVGIVLAICFVTIVLKAFLFFYTNRSGKKSRNPMILALAEDHRSDVFVTSATVIGVLGSHFGIAWLDPLFGIFIAIVIGRAGFLVLRDAYMVLMDTTQSASSPLIEFATRTIVRFPEVDHIDSIVARPIGTRYFLEIKISLPGDMTVRDSHQVGKAIELELLKNENIADALIHINPM